MPFRLVPVWHRALLVVLRVAVAGTERLVTVRHALLWGVRGAATGMLVVLGVTEAASTIRHVTAVVEVS